MTSEESFSRVEHLKTERRKIDLSRWRDIKEKLVERLTALGLPPDDARRASTVLAEVWHSAEQMETHVEEIAGDDPGQGLANLLIQLRSLDLNTPWFISESKRAWRLTMGTVWESSKDELELLVDILQPSFANAQTLNDFAAGIRDARHLAREISVVLSDRELRSVAKTAPPAKLRRTIRNAFTKVHRLGDDLIRLLPARSN